MKNNLIKSIFTNLLFVIGVILIIIGFVSGTKTVTYLALFEKYPLDQYKETMCDNAFLEPMYLDKNQPQAEQINKQDLENRRLKCEKQLEIDRNVKKATDVATSITILISGIVLVYFFRRFIFSKNS